MFVFVTMCCVILKYWMLMYRSNMVDLCVFVFVCSSVSYIAKTVDWQSKNRAVTVPLCANASWSPAQRDLTTSDKAVEYRTGTLLFLCWNDAETGLSTQRANDRYKAYLNLIFVIFLRWQNF